jgi:hypothetical protein
MALRVAFLPSTGSNVDISARVRAYTMSLTANAEQGSVAISQLVVDDPEGGINITGLRNLFVSETSEASNQIYIYTGWTADRDITRGESFRTGSARQWTVNLADANAFIGRRIMRGADANRPAETDVARIQWLLSTSEFGGIVPTSRYVSTLFPVAMDAVDYRDQSNQQILDDCSQQSGKNYFVFYDEPVLQYGLYYDFPGSSAYRSSLRLTNILGYVDNDITFGVSETETKLNRDPSRVYSGVVLPFVGGEVYVQNDTIANTFVRRDTTAPSYNVKTAAKATARANRYIVDAATEADVITTSFLVPLSRVNHLREGQAVQCRFAHFPGYDQGWNWMRVLKRTVTATSEEFYTIEVEMAAAVGGLTADGSASSGVPVTDPVPLQSCVGLNHLTYYYTAGGTRTGLGPPYLSGGNWTYVGTEFMTFWRTGGSASEYPLAGQVGDWGNGGTNNCVYSSGGVDYAGGGGTRFITITVIGPGTLSVTTAAAVGLCANSGTITATAVRSGTAFVVDSTSGVPGDTLSVTIPDDGYCAHFIEVGGGVGGGEFGFVSATWTP